MLAAHRPTWLAFVCLCGIGGCANLAVMPPTPARYLDLTGLGEPPPAERFYVVLFGSESTPRIPRFSHSWCVVVHVTEQGEGCPPRIETHTISWMPSTLQIRCWSPRIERGENLGLQETLRWAQGTGQRIAQWGPCECRPELFYRLATQHQFLESGRIGYQCIDTMGEAFRTGNGCDCIHAITDADPEFNRAHYRLIGFGIPASRFIASELRCRDMLINPDYTHEWLNQVLGLNAYRIDEHWRW